MFRLPTLIVLILAVLLPACQAMALLRPDKTFKVFQFPPNMIPRIDGDASDWSIVPDDYSIGMDEMVDDGHPENKPDPAQLDAKVKVGWVKGESRLYFLYQAKKKFWDFAATDLHNDTFEIVVDGDRSGGPLIAEQQYEVVDKKRDQWDAYFTFQNVHAQNYHIFTPAEGKDWCMVWGPQSWMKSLPYANHAYSYNFKPGESGSLNLEFFITPFDYASADGPQKSIPSTLKENNIIGLAWAIIQYDGPRTSTHFWNLSRDHKMYGNASSLCAFKLMPLEPQFTKTLTADWSFKVVDMDRRLVAFKDETVGKVTSWSWDFGDKTTSTEQNPIHSYTAAGHYVVVLNVDGPDGKSRRSKVWDVAVR